MKTRLWPALAFVLLLTVLPGCEREETGQRGGLAITSTAFADGQPIPERHSCDGENVSPPLAWSGAPAAARSFVLLVDDPDAPGGTFTHWIVFNLPAEALVLAEGVKALPGGAGQGVNDFGRAGYGGPCPPGGRHRYFHRLYALDTRLTGLARPGRKQIDAALEGHVLAEAALIGTYQR